MAGRGALATVVIVVIVLLGAVAYLLHGGYGESSTSPITSQSSGAGSAMQTSTTGATGAVGEYTIRAATLLGGISTLDIIEYENLTAKYGYPLQVLRLQKTPDILAAIAKGEADLAVVPAEMAAKMIEGGSDVVIVAVDMMQNQAILAKDPTIRNVTDLRGRLVGAVVASGTYKLFKAYMNIVYGIPVVESGERAPGAISVVNVPPGSILDAVENGQVDAIVIWEPFVSKGISTGLHVVASFADLWREANVSGEPVMLVWIARGDFVRSHVDALNAFLAARSKAASIWISDKNLTYQILSSLYHLSKPEFDIMYNRTVIVAGNLTDNLIESIRSEWWLAWKGGYLPEDPATIPASVFYTG